MRKRGVSTDSWRGHYEPFSGTWQAAPYQYAPRELDIDLDKLKLLINGHPRPAEGSGP